MFPSPFQTFLLVMTLGLAAPTLCLAQIDLNPANPKPMLADQSSDQEIPETADFAKPYDYERQAYGYDPEGIVYHENQVEDLQVIFITSLPFTAAGSYCLTGLASLVTRGQFSVGGDFFFPFLGGVLVGSTTIMCVSVLSNPYPPPASTTIVQGFNPLPALAFKVPLLTARF